jgi:tryptophan synthase alpha chain
MQIPDTNHRRTKAGIERIEDAIGVAQRTRSAALMPYFTLGYPDAKTSLEIIEAISSHSDILELGIPFSDPLADGPTIQHSTQISLERGTTVGSCIKMVSSLRKRGIATPVLLMGYLNPILAYGIREFVADAAASGAAGFIVPDLPFDEGEQLDEWAGKSGLALIRFLTLVTSESRLERVTKGATGFIYLVGVTGVTGARNQLESDLNSFIAKVRQRTEVPLAVGFGIGTPSLAAYVGEIADGVIVGSALLDAVNKADDKPAAAVSFVRMYKQALSADIGS